MTADAAVELLRQQWRERQRRCHAAHGMATKTAEGNIGHGSANANGDF